MRSQVLGLSLLLVGLGAGPVHATWPQPTGGLSVEVVTDGGDVLSSYPVGGRQRPGTARAYLEAVRGAEYGIRIRNDTGSRIGLVVTVDGRNVLSGKQSRLRASEPMYILGPWETRTYEGWRTSASQVHRFYFTDAAGSYAEAFGDRSAMGVIAVAAFRERVPEPRAEQRWQEGEGPAGRAARAPAAPSAKAAESASDEAGTGFGRGKHSRVVRVRFEPQPRAFARRFLKYEWRETLVRLGVVPGRPPSNRFWPDDATVTPGYDFAPYPPGYRDVR